MDTVAGVSNIYTGEIRILLLVRKRDADEKLMLLLVRKREILMRYGYCYW